MNFTESPVLQRHPSNPILTAAHIPYRADLVFNAGVCRFQGRYVMVFRNDFGATQQDFDDFYAGRRSEPPRFQTNIGLAFSDDGVHWDAQPRPCFSLEDNEILRAYDPRLTVVDGRVFMCFAVDTKHGLRGGVAVTDDFETFDILSLSLPDNRNMVLFPRRIGGRYLRLERPFPVYSRGGIDRFDLWLGASPDLKYWGDYDLVLGVEDVPFADDKIGPAAPPVWTPRGWLTTFHAVDRDDQGRGKNGWEKKWTKRYHAGLMLLDLDDPTQVVGMSKQPILTPSAPYETEGFRNDVIFPGGMILEDSGEVKIYYGGADTVECLATAHVDDLLALCTRPR